MTATLTSPLALEPPGAPPDNLPRVLADRVDRYHRTRLGDSEYERRRAAAFALAEADTVWASAHRVDDYPEIREPGFPGPEAFFYGVRYSQVLMLFDDPDQFTGADPWRRRDFIRRLIEQGRAS